MSVYYPYSIPPLNKFTVPTIGAVDVLDRDSVVIDYPASYGTLLFGMLSLLSEVYIYPDNDTLSRQELVDIYNNEVLIVRDVCDVFTECIENSPALRSALTQLINENALSGGSVPGGSSALIPSPSGNLDCLYGGVVQWLTHAFEQADRWIADAIATVNLLEDALDFFTFGIASTIRTLISITSNVSLPLIRNEIASTSFQEGYFCRAFAFFANLPEPLSPTVSDIENYIASEQVLVPNAAGMFYAVMVNLSAGDLLKRMVLGFDECDNDWLLCPGTTQITATVPATTINPTSVTLPVTGLYSVSVTGTYIYNNLGCTADGLYALTGAGCSIATLSPRLQINTAAGWVDLIPDTLIYADGRGYLFRLDAAAVSQQLRIFDTDYADNSGNLVVRFLRLS